MIDCKFADSNLAPEIQTFGALTSLIRNLTMFNLWDPIRNFAQRHQGRRLAKGHLQKPGKMIGSCLVDSQKELTIIIGMYYLCIYIYIHIYTHIQYIIHMCIYNTHIICICTDYKHLITCVDIQLIHMSIYFTFPYLLQSQWIIPHPRFRVSAVEPIHGVVKAQSSDACPWLPALTNNPQGDRETIIEDARDACQLTGS